MTSRLNKKPTTTLVPPPVMTGGELCQVYVELLGITVWTTK